MGSKQHNPVPFPPLQTKYSCFLHRTIKHVCTYQVDATREGQMRTHGKTLDLNFSCTGETEASFQSWFKDSSTSSVGQPEIPIQTTSESRGSWFSLWFERREFRSGFGRTGEAVGLSDLGEEKGIVCLQKKQASKQMNTVFPSEDHIDYETNKRKAQKQDSTGTPRLAVSAVTGLERLSVLSAAADRQHTESSSLIIRQLSHTYRDRICGSAWAPC